MTEARNLFAKSIDYAEGLSLPLEIASSPIAFLAQRGRGKSRGAMGLACAFHDAGIPPVTIDAAGVWWGLRLAKDGKGRGLDLPVLGGLHGDAPLAPTGGKVLAEALVRTRRGCVIDTTGFDTEAEKKRFVSDFAETFYRAKMKSRSPVHLFLEEADEWIPEQPGPDEARMLGAFQRITRLGRNFGIGITLISQRPQGLSKKVLNLAEVVITLGMAGAHETKAMKAWMDDHEVSAERRAEVMNKLPRLGWNKFERKDGGALIWAPQLNLFDIVKIKAPRTFDSSATPEVGDDAEVKALPALDLDELSKAMAATVEESKANDPKLLRAEIVKLKAELARKPSAALAQVVPAEPVRIVLPDPDLMKQLSEAKLAAEDHQRNAQTAASNLWKVADSIDSQIRAAIGAAKLRGADPAFVRTGFPSARKGGPVPNPPESLPRKALTVSTGPGDASLGGGERKILTVLAQYDGRTKVQVALLTGYSSGGGGFKNYIGALRSRGLIADRGEQLVITDAGRTALGEYDDLPTGDALREMWLGQLSKAERAALEVLIKCWPETATREEVAEEAGYEPDGGGFKNALGRLRTLELIEGHGAMKASDTLFDEGER